MRDHVLRILFCGLLACSSRVVAAADAVPDYLADRGDGIHTSMFGTFVHPDETLLYAFYEYTRTSKSDYNPSEFGYALDQDFVGKETSHEALLFWAYGINDRLMVEVESALIAKTILERDPTDASGMPPQLSETGFGDTEGQVRWIWLKETADRPELMLTFEAVLPLQKDRLLIGTQDLELAPGFAFIKGLPIGTVQARYSWVYTTEDHTIDTDEYAVEWTKRFSDRQRWTVAYEAGPGEASLIGELQLTLGSGAVLKLNCGFGLTDETPDIAPEVGVMWSF